LQFFHLQLSIRTLSPLDLYLLQTPLSFQNFPFSDIMILNIQVLVLFLGWLALAVIPYMMYELAIAITKNNLKKFLQKLKSN